MTAVAHLLPANAAEAEIAVLIVAAQFHAKDALGCAAKAATCDDPGQVRRCRAQAASMMAQADRTLRTLIRMQAERQKAEDAMRPAVMQRAGYWFRSIEPEPAPEPVPRPPAPDPPRQEYSDMTEAERYAVLYPDRAACILAANGLPNDPRFPPPGDDVLRDLLTATSPLVRAAIEQHHATTSREARL